MATPDDDQRGGHASLKVCLATNSYAPDMGGLAVIVHGLATGLMEGGCEVSVIAQVAASSTAPDRETLGGIEVFRFRNRLGGRRFGYAPSLTRFLHRHDDEFDVVHAFSFHAPTALATSIATHRPFFFTPVFHRGGHSPLASAVHVLYDPVASRIFKQAEQVFCLTEAERRSLVGRYPVVRNRTQVVPVAVQADPFVMPYDEPRPVVLSAGRLDDYKRVDVVIEAFGLLDVDADLVILGEGPEHSKLADLTRTLHLEDRVRLLGEVDEESLRRWQRTAHVAVSLSTNESFGLSLAEGAAAGALVIASDLPAHRDMLSLIEASGEFVSASASPREVAGALERSLAEPRGTVGAIKNRTWRDVASEVESFYRASLTQARMAS